MNLLKKKRPYVYDEVDSKKKKPKRSLFSKKDKPENEPNNSDTVEEATQTDSNMDSTPNAIPEKTVKKKKEKKPKQPKPPKKPKDPAKQIQIGKRGIIGICSIVAALLVAFVLSPLVTRVANEETAIVVRAKQDIAKGSVLEATSFETVTVPARGLPKNAVQNIDEIVGQYAAVDIPAGDTVLVSKASDSIPFPDSYLYELPEGKQAMSIRIKSFENGLSGKLLKGDIVSVYATLSSGSDEESYLATAPPELKFVPVLSVTTETGANYNKQVKTEAGENQDELPVTIELLVSDVQAAALAGLNQNASIHLSLVSRGNTEYEQYLLGLQEFALAEMQEQNEMSDVSQISANDDETESIEGEEIKEGEQNE